MESPSEWLFTGCWVNLSSGQKGSNLPGLCYKWHSIESFLISLTWNDDISNLWTQHLRFNKKTSTNTLLLSGLRGFPGSFRNKPGPRVSVYSLTHKSDHKWFLKWMLMARIKKRTPQFVSEGIHENYSYKVDVFFYVRNSDITEAFVKGFNRYCERREDDDHDLEFLCKDGTVSFYQVKEDDANC